MDRKSSVLDIFHDVLHKTKSIEITCVSCYMPAEHVEMLAWGKTVKQLLRSFAWLEGQVQQMSPKNDPKSVLVDFGPDPKSPKKLLDDCMSCRLWRSACGDKDQHTRRSELVAPCYLLCQVQLDMGIVAGRSLA